MFGTVRRYSLKAGGVRQLAPLVEKEFIPILQTVPGFVSYSLIDAGSENGRDVLATVSIFTTREGAEESVRRAADWVGKNLGDFEPSKPIVTGGEIVVTTDTARQTSDAYTK